MRMQRALVFWAIACLALVVASRATAAPLTAARPTIAITSPGNGATVYGSAVTIHVAIANFKLVPPVLLSPAQWKTIPLLKGNQGHIHYILDSLANLVLTRDVTMRLDHTWTHVSPGWHTVTAYLATSQHAPFPGARPATIRVHVLASRAPRARPVSRTTGSHPRAGGSTVRMVRLPRTGGAMDTQQALKLDELLTGIGTCLLGLVLLARSVKRL